MIGLLRAHPPAAPAMWHRSRGQWRGWRWQDVLADVTALAGALHAHGAGNRLILLSESRPEALIAVLAAHWLGAELVTADATHAIADTAADADLLRAAGHTGTITLIDPPPGETGLAAFIANAPAPPPPVPSTPEPTPAAPALHGFCQSPLRDPAEFRANILPFLRDGGTLTFPERPDTVAADLREARPERFSATSAQWHALHETLARRIPPARLTWPFAATRIRRQLGLDRARLLLAHGGPLAPAPTAFFAAIGLPLTEIAADAIPR